MKRRFQTTLACAALGLCWQALAFDLDELRAQLLGLPVTEGRFVQEKHLRALPQPLVSAGRFTLTPGQALIWQLETPLTQTLRITPDGVARLSADERWQAMPGSAGRESRLFLALLAGDTKGLAQDFNLRLDGDADHWNVTLTPNSSILQQIFTRIEIEGGRLIQRIAMYETQGDYTVLRMQALPPEGTTPGDGPIPDTD